MVHGFSRAIRISALLAVALSLTQASASAAPVADFTVPPVVVSGSPATFSSTSVPSEGDTITSIQWSFGDGTPGATGPTVQHVFGSPGTVEVTLTVADGTGSASVSKPVTVMPPPVASFIFTPDPPVAGRPATFAATALPVPGQAILATEWDFNSDGIFDASGASVEHVFPAAGSQVVRLRVQDSSGVSAELLRRLTVNAPPEAGFSVSPAEPTVGQQVSFVSKSGDAEGPLVDQSWDLDGDGDFNDASGASVSGMFVSPGRHTVALRVTDGAGASSTRTRVITVRAPEASRPFDLQGRTPEIGSGAPFLRLMSPFPIVRLAGQVLAEGARIQRLSVRAPKGAQVVVRCRGRRCPSGRVAKRAGRRPVRVRSLERFLPAGSALTVLVRRADEVGKYTHFRIRRGRAPRRFDRCVLPNGTAAVRCPRT